MKANAQEKIYITPHFERRWFTRKIDDAGVEYTRTDAFIEKAATWIANRYQSNGSYLNADDIEDFRNYMKGE